MQLDTLWIGPAGQGEFEVAFELLRTTTQLRCTASVADAVRRESDKFPDLIVLPQPWPGCFQLSELELLRHRFPLARLISLLGSWCEGEQRSGRPVPAAWPIHWLTWPTHFAAELQRVHDGLCPLWGLPVTVTEAERAAASSTMLPSTGAGLVLIQAAAREMGDCLRDACIARGFSTITVPLDPTPPSLHLTGLKAAVWEAACCDAIHSRSLQDLARVARDVPLIALLDFPRLEDVRRAISLGATHVLPKPLSWDDLFTILQSPVATHHIA